MTGKKIVAAGASGLIGQKLVDRLENNGDEVRRLLRRESQANDLVWDPSSGKLDSKELEGCDAVLCLNGVDVAGRRWSAAYKDQLRDSRLNATGLLARSIAGLKQPPKVFLVASAIGFYGDCGDTSIQEDGPRGKGFLAELCGDWEAAAQPAVDAGVRVVNLRIGVVLSPHGGALAKMHLPFKLGLGGRIGSGAQYMSWIAIEDVVAAIHFCMEQEALNGPVNLVAPNPVSNAEFTKALGKALSRPTLLPVPSFAIRMVFGQMGEELLLAGARVEPKKLVDAGFVFSFPNLADTLACQVKK